MGPCDENLDATQMDMKNSLNEKLEEKYGYTRVVFRLGSLKRYILEWRKYTPSERYWKYERGLLGIF